MTPSWRLTVVGAVLSFLMLCLGCATCACGGGPDRSLAASAPDCVTPCGARVWFGEMGPPNCAHVVLAEQSALACFGDPAILPGSTPDMLCSAMRGMEILMNKHTSFPPMGWSWLADWPVNPTLVMEIYDSGDFRTNAYTHEMGHITQKVVYNEADPDHEFWCDANATRPGFPKCENIRGAMSCTAGKIVAGYH